MSRIFSGYHFNECGCPHMGYIDSWDKHAAVCDQLLDFIHALLHKRAVTQKQIDEEFNSWPDDDEIGI